jgi:SAM-dependent methyltransferase
MPTIEENKQYWDGGFSWASGGDEWSRDWGDVPTQWFGTILPRIHSFLPAGTILEIGCGYGRWTQFLQKHCSRLVAIDLSGECIDACRVRFADMPHVSCHLNDGTSLAAVDDLSIDFVFSFDALPLVDRRTIESYLAQFGRVLTPGGVAFIHHSNLGAYNWLYGPIRSVPGLDRLLKSVRLLDRDLYWRDWGVSARFVRQVSTKHGLACTAQEVIQWGTRYVRADALSVLVRNDAPTARPCRRVRTNFDEEARHLRVLARSYRLDARRPTSQE